MITVASLQSFNEIWQRTSLVQRVLLAGIGLACVGAAALVVGWVRQPTYALLYGGLAPAEAARIVEKVQDESVAYETRDGGSAVYVDAAQVRQLRMKLAAQNLPSGGHAGYTILEAQRIGTSPYMQKVNHIRAVEGELSMTLEVLDAVVKARVKVAQAREGMFESKNKTPASASVMLRLRRGALLTAGNIAAIVNLVAGGVEGLNSAHVTVVDADGNLLSDEGGTEISKAARTAIDQKFQVEDRLGRRIENHLQTVLGPGRATVQVSAVIDTTSKTETVKAITGDALSRTLETVKTTDPADGAKGGAQKETTSETDFMPGESVTVSQTQPGKITDLSVSCFVDLTPPKAAEGAEAPTAHKLTEENVKTAIRTALGMDAAKLTSLEVVNTPFYRDPTAETAGLVDVDDGLLSTGFLLEMGRRVSLGVLVIGVLLGLKIVRKGRNVKAAGVPGVEGEIPRTENLLAAAADGDPETLRVQITQALQENPDEVKRLFLSWVNSEQGEA